ncbi:MAG TPA: LLM class flavin-dependent oxidoreductase [Nitrososphaerales archaeon]|nr:LLM class flavin-dependent oxidoreductase [Nitrososphaerales archaeon]
MTLSVSDLGIAFSCRGDPRELLKSAKLAEKAGFGSIWLIEVNDIDAIGIAAALTSVTQKITIATGVVNSNLRLPTLLAMGAATISRLSNGRFILGVGAGNPPMRYAVEIKSNTPVRRMSETLRIVSGCLNSQGRQFDFDGKLYRVNGFKMDLAPEHRVPVYGAAMGTKMIETVTKYGDSVILMLPTLDHVKSVIPKIDAILKQRGMTRSASNSLKSFQVACHLVTVVSEDEDEAETYAKLTVANYAAIPIYHQNFSRLGFSKELESIDEALAKGGPKEATTVVPRKMVEGTIVYGSAKQCMKKISDFMKAGITLPIVYPSNSGPLPYPDRVNKTISMLAS